MLGQMNTHVTKCQLKSGQLQSEFCATVLKNSILGSSFSVTWKLRERAPTVVIVIKLSILHFRNILTPSKTVL